MAGGALPLAAEAARKPRDEPRGATPMGVVSSASGVGLSAAEHWRAAIVQGRGKVQQVSCVHLHMQDDRRSTEGPAMEAPRCNQVQGAAAAMAFLAMPATCFL